MRRICRIIIIYISKSINTLVVFFVLHKEDMAQENHSIQHDIVKYLENGNYKKIEEILHQMKENDRRVELESFTPESDKVSILHVAVVLGDICFVQKLIQKGIKLEIQTHYFRPLHLAMFFNQNGMMRLLLKNGANPNIDR